MTITVFTPSYNRAYCLGRLYESLLSQSNKNFVWLIVDDGSTDDTHSIVQGWISDNKLNIEYKYKENGGMHTAHNTAYQLITTELNVCIDSDDYMPKDAIESILNEWEHVSNDANVAGLVGLDEDISGNLIGKPFKNEHVPTDLLTYYHVENGAGDKKLVLRSELTKAYPSYPEYVDEKLVPLDTLYTLICRDYSLIPVNKSWVVVDYQQDGSSATVIKQYFQSPRGFRYAREVAIANAPTLFFKLKNIIHCNVSSIILKDPFYWIKKSRSLTALLLLPLSYLVFKYLTYKR